MGTHSRQQAAYLLKNMKVISAYMLAVVGGNASPSADDVKKLLSSVGIDLSGDESSQLDTLVSSFAEKSLDEVLKEGNALLATAPGGGSGGAAGGAAAGGASDAPAAAAEEEEEEEEELAPAADLFGGGDDY